MLNYCMLVVTQVILYYFLPLSKYSNRTVTMCSNRAVILNYSNRTINTLISMNGNARQTLINANILARIMLSFCDFYELMFRTIPCISCMMHVSDYIHMNPAAVYTSLDIMLNCSLNNVISSIVKLISTHACMHMVWYVYHTMYARYVTLACMNVQAMQAIIDMHACLCYPLYMYAWVYSLSICKESIYSIKTISY